AETLILYSGLFPHSLSLNKNSLAMIIASKALIVLLLLFFILLIGFLARQLIWDRLFTLSNRLFIQIPYVSKIYQASQDVVTSLFSPSSSAFIKVVYIPFPQKGKMSLGFVTSERIKIEGLDADLQEYHSVFVPGTPNPTGCLLLVKREHMVDTTLTVDQAMRF